MKKILNFPLVAVVFLSLLSIGNLFADDDEIKTSKIKYGPLIAPKAVPLAFENDFFRKEKAPDFWALVSYYIPQANPYSCSAASVCMVLNGMNARTNRPADAGSITQKEVVEKVNVENWRERVSLKGLNGKHGVTIEDLGKIVEAALKTYKMNYQFVETVALTPNTPNLDEQKKKLISVLTENEKCSTDFVILHFNQGVCTDDFYGAHISPVGAFDSKKMKVLILDVDRAWYAAVAGWVRAPLAGEKGAMLRADLDRLVLQAIIPERLRQVPPASRDARQQAVLQMEWETIKKNW
jgi:hypothetical protein